LLIQIRVNYLHHSVRLTFFDQYFTNLTADFINFRV